MYFAKKHEDLMYHCCVFAWGQYGFDLVFMKNLGFSVCLWDVQMLFWFGIDFAWFSDLQDVDLFCGQCVSECWDVSWGTGNSSPATTWIWRPSIPLSPFWSGSAVVCSLVFGHVMVSTLVHYLWTILSSIFYPISSMILSSPALGYNQTQHVGHRQQHSLR
jgi:hypothetical protein